MTTMSLSDPLKRHLGHAVKRFRIGRGLTQEMLAEVANVSVSSLSQFERGEKMGAKNFGKIAAALQVSEVAILEDVRTEVRGIDGALLDLMIQAYKLLHELDAEAGTDSIPEDSGKSWSPEPEPARGTRSAIALLPGSGQ